MVMHCILFWGKDIIKAYKSTREGTNDDRHHEHMAKKYKETPALWYATVLLISFILGLVTVLKEDNRSLSAKLQCACLHVTVCGHALDGLTGAPASRESDLADLHVAGESFATFAGAGEDLNNTGWEEAGFLDELGEEDGGERGFFGGFHLSKSAVWCGIC